MAACGGGGGGGSTPSPPPSPPPPPPGLSISVAASSLDVISREGASQATLTLDIRQSGSAPTPVVPDLSYDSSLLTLQGPVSLGSDGIYRIVLRSPNNLALGDYPSNVRFRLCQEAACTNVYSNTTLNLPTNIRVLLRDWSTFQRDATHAGYVALTIDPAKIAQIWQYSPATSIGLGRVSADAARVYVSTYTGGAFSLGTVAAVSLKDGSEVWRGTAGPMAHIGEPAVTNGRMLIAITDTSSETNPIFIVNAETGAQVGLATFSSQAANSYLASTPIDDEFYQAAGYYGNDVFSYRLSDGGLRWKSHGSGYDVWFSETPAADAQFVYYYNGEGLDVFRRSDGALAVTIPDPGHVWNGYDYAGAPVLLADGSVAAYSGTTGGAQFLDTSYDVSRPIVRYLPSAGAIAWRTIDKYRTVLAARGALIFAARNQPTPRLDAINIADGSIAWSWTPTPGSKFRSNIVVTDNALFVGTTTTTYCISLSDQSVLWSYGAPGALAIAPGNILLISEANPQDMLTSNNKLTAFRLR